ncbi:MAG: hypothetical protein AseanaTS_05760 [Candidatus Pelagadaptatus aseana]
MVALFVGKLGKTLIEALRHAECIANDEAAFGCGVVDLKKSGAQFSVVLALDGYGLGHTESFELITGVAVLGN